MIKALIFDVGGTLVKTDRAILTALTQALHQEGIMLKNKQAVINVFGQGQRKNVSTAVEHSYTGKDRAQKIESCYQHFQRLFPSSVMSQFELLPYVKEGLTFLRSKGIKTAVLTGFDRRETDFFLQEMGLQPYFGLVLSAEDIVEHRPHPLGLLLALEKLKLKKEEVLYVGDAWVDIRFARNAGVKVACLKTGAQEKQLLEKEKPDWLVENFAELVEKIKPLL